MSASSAEAVTDAPSQADAPRVTGAPSQADVPRVTDAPSQADAPRTVAPAATPFTMVNGDPAAMVCTDDVCFVPGTQPPA
jgi:hypothetical protein